MFQAKHVRTIVAAGLTTLVMAGSWSSTAEARPRYWHRYNNGGAIAAGIIGGAALGAILASSQRRYYGYARPYYYGRPAYYGYRGYYGGYYGPRYYARPAYYGGYYRAGCW